MTSPTSASVTGAASAGSTLRAAVWTGASQLGIERRARAACPDGWLLIRPDRVGLCGTDLSILNGHHGRARPPLVLGHEITGTVESHSAEAPPPGTRVVVNPTLACGTCWPCRHQLGHTCLELKLIGIDIDGALSEVVAVPATSVFAVQPHVTADQAVLAEPLAVAIHAVDRASLGEGSTAVVVGAGPIGILIGLVAADRGCRVLVSEPRDTRRQLAQELGFHALPPDLSLVAGVRDATDGALSDVVFDCAGHPSVAAQLSAVTRVRGTIVLAGLYSAPTAVDLHALTFAEQHLVGSLVYTDPDLRQAVAMIEANTLDLSRVPTQTYGLDEVDEAVAAAARGDVVKAMVNPGA
jgi:(R,R)-butanediol dehydrogenase/meso-butanediol dehydrogenase/diacetyl reductase